MLYIDFISSPVKSSASAPLFTSLFGSKSSNINVIAGTIAGYPHISGTVPTVVFLDIPRPLPACLAGTGDCPGYIFSDK